MRPLTAAGDPAGVLPVATAKVTIRRVADLEAHDWDELHDFGSRYFEGAFVENIRTKRDLVRLRGGDGLLVGIGTADVFELTHTRRTVTVIYAGNTAFADATRGQGLVHRIGFRYFMQAKRRHPFRPVYAAFTTFSWRSYLSLTRNFTRSWPRRHEQLPGWEAGLYRQVGLRLFGEQYDPDAGVARNLDRRLRPDVAALPDRLAADPDVRYFITRNPGYAGGDVLLCLAPLSVANWWSAARRIMRRRPRRAASCR
jgi:hypothetical protein